MTAFPTRTTGRGLWLFALFAASIATSAATSPEHDLQALGARIGEFASRLETLPPAPDELAAVHREFAVLQSRIESADSGLVHKYRAVALQLANLEQSVAHRQAVRDDKPAMRIEREVISARHGSNCATALGLAEGAQCRRTSALTQAD